MPCSRYVIEPQPLRAQLSGRLAKNSPREFLLCSAAPLPIARKVRKAKK